LRYGAMKNKSAGLSGSEDAFLPCSDPTAKRQLGNFPRAFSHTALINSAKILSEKSGSHATQPGKDSKQSSN
jgi:hypothetical protein